MRGNHGFTLIEMISVMVITTILASVVWRAIVPQIAGARDATTRAALVDYAETALSRMTRELRLALPNSIRINNAGNAIEFLRTRSGGRYRAEGDGSNNDLCTAPDADAINLANTRDCVEMVGGMPNAAQIVSGSGGRTACMAGRIDCIAIYNTGQSGANAYAGDDLAGVAAVVNNARGVALTFDRSDVGTLLPRASPNQRLHVVDSAVSFVCDLGARTLNRYAGYGISAAMAVPPAGTAQPLALEVSACVFRYTPGTATRAGLVSVEIAVSATNTSAGTTETVSLLQQVSVVNAP